MGNLDIVIIILVFFQVVKIKINIKKVVYFVLCLFFIGSDCRSEQRPKKLYTRLRFQFSRNVVALFLNKEYID